MAIRIGITGGIGSGKSVVSKILSLLDIPIYLSDDEAKRLTATDETIRRELTDLLGDELYQGGILNKQKLANYLFASSENAEKVNAIIDILKQRYPDAPCALHYGKDYELMIAVRLSAQCMYAHIHIFYQKIRILKENKD